MAGFSVKYTGGKELVKRLRKLEDGGEVAIKRTVSDFTSRAPAWVSKGIREHYGVDTAAIKTAEQRPKRGKTTIRVAGIAVDGASLEYKGPTLTPLHFKMSPKQRPAGQQGNMIRIPGQAIAGAGDVAMIRPPKPYKVKATIIKGQRTTFPSNTFLTSSNGSGSIPFQRTGAGRTPIEAVHTLSVPQMIDGRAKGTIEGAIESKLGARFQHHVGRIMK